MNKLDRAVRPEKRLLTWVDVVRAGSGDPEALAAIERHLDEPENARLRELFDRFGEENPENDEWLDRELEEEEDGTLKDERRTPNAQHRTPT